MDASLHQRIAAARDALVRAGCNRPTPPQTPRSWRVMRSAGTARRSSRAVRDAASVLRQFVHGVRRAASARDPVA